MMAVQRPPRGGSVLRLSAGRLLRLELRRNAMTWMVPLIVAMFLFDTYRSSMALPVLWASRTLYLQRGAALLDFAPFVAGVAAWTGSRDSRRGTDEQVASTPLPRWAPRLSSWTATACWALATYLGCMALLLGVTASQGARGVLPWWPIAVGAVGVAAFSALGFAAGAIFPSRFTVPLTAFVAFLGLILSQYAITHSSTYGLISPLNTQGVPGPQAGAFYPYLPDLSITQLIFLAGLAVMALGAIGLRSVSGGLGSRAIAAAVTAVGLAAAGTGLGLAGAARITANGVVISAVHNAADDQRVSYAPVCSHSVIPVCLSPVYRAYLPNLSRALDPLLSEVAGLPGAPVRVTQTAFPDHSDAVYSTVAIGGSPAVLHLAVNIGAEGATCFVTGPRSSTCVAVTKLWNDSSLVTDVVRPHAAATVISSLVGHAGAAQQAVSAGMLIAIGVRLTDPAAAQAHQPGAPLVIDPEIQLSGPAPGTPVYTAAHRFAALPAATRHAWLATHLTALRNGQVALAQLP